MGTSLAVSACMNALRHLRSLGQSVWVDYLDRALLLSEELQRLISQDGLSGMTSNPTIFQRAIASSGDYDDTIRASPATYSDAQVFERIAVEDVARACDCFRPVYDKTNGADGFVSIEVSPELAHDAESTVAEARRLRDAVDRPNLMVKIPATLEGLEAIEHCLVEGINVNVTLLFAVERYRQVVEAFLAALETRAARGQPVGGISSAASMFVSRIDKSVDRALDALPAGGAREAGRLLRGHIAIANARLAFHAYEDLIASERWSALAAKGARPQRLLWASTTTKDPAYGDMHYADALVAPGTIDTMTLETLRAYLDHGCPEVRIRDRLDRARGEVASLANLGIDLDAVTTRLEEEGVSAFVESHRRALSTIAERRRALAAAVEASRSGNAVPPRSRPMKRDPNVPAEPERYDPRIGASQPDASTWGWEHPYSGPPEGGQPRAGSASRRERGTPDALRSGMAIQRHPALRSLSRDHHIALQLAQGLQAGTSPRLRAELPREKRALVAYVQRVFAEELAAHFDAEHSILAPAIAGKDADLDRIALAIESQHADMNALVARLSDPALDEAAIDATLDRLGHMLEDHVRREERDYYKRIQEVLDEPSLQRLGHELTRHLVYHGQQVGRVKGPRPQRSARRCDG